MGDDEYCGDNCEGDGTSVVSESSFFPKLPSSVEKDP